MPQVREKTRMIHARIDPRLKALAERVFSKVGTSTTEAIRLFLKQVELHVVVRRGANVSPQMI